jgi:hypothetical protein
MAKKKRKKPKSRNIHAHSLQDPKFQPKIVPVKKHKKDIGPNIKEWE